MTWHAPEAREPPMARCHLCLAGFDRRVDPLQNSAIIKSGRKVSEVEAGKGGGTWVSFNVFHSIWDDWPVRYLICPECMPEFRRGTCTKRRIKKLVKGKSVERAVNILTYGEARD